MHQVNWMNFCIGCVVNTILYIHCNFIVIKERTLTGLQIQQAVERCYE